MTEYFVDYKGGNDSNDGTDFANRTATIDAVFAQHTMGAGDRVRIMKSPDPVDLGIQATFTSKSLTITLASSLTQEIYSDGAWTAETGDVTCSEETTNVKEGASSARIAIGAGFTTGVAATFATAGTVNLGGYQKLSFWLWSDTALDSGALQINLRNSVGGNLNTVVYNRAVNAGTWTCITIDNGVVLGNGVESVALEVLSAVGSCNLIIDNMFACNDLNLNSLIGKNDNCWWAVKSIVGTTVALEGPQTTSLVGAGQGYYGTSETVELYSAEAVVHPFYNQQAGYINSRYTNNPLGAGNEIIISGGWDETAMTVQTGNTFLDAVDSIGYFAGTVSADRIYENLGFFRFYGIDYVQNMWITYRNIFASCIFYGFNNNQGTNTETFHDLYFCNFANTTFVCVGENNYNLNMYGGTVSIIAQTHAVVYEDLVICNGVGGNGLTGTKIVLRNLTMNDNLVYCWYDGLQADFYNFEAHNNGTGVFYIDSGTNHRIYGLNTSGNPNGMFHRLGSGNTIYVKNWIRGEADPVPSEGNTRIISERDQGDISLNVTWSDMGTIRSQSSITQSGSGIAWEFEPKNPGAYQRSGAFRPLILPVGTFAVKATKTLTVNYYAARTDGDIEGTLRIVGGRYTGVGSIGTDITTTVDPTPNASPSSSDFAPYSVSCTPTEDQVVEVFFEVNSNTFSNKVYLDGGAAVST